MWGKNMLDFIFQMLVYSFAIYGIIEMIKKIIYIMDYTNLSEDRNIHNNRCEKSREENRRSASFNTF
jgi:hypothetical protein